MQLGASVYPVNPLSAKSYRERKASSGNKTDHLDAWSLAEALRLAGQHWKALRPMDAVTPASTAERDGAQLLLGRVLGGLTWLRILWVDGGYTGETFVQWVKTLRLKLAVEVVKRLDDLAGFNGLPHRWVVECTFGWLMLSADWCAITKPATPAPRLGFISQ